MKRMKRSANGIRKLFQCSLALALAAVMLMSTGLTAYAAADSASLDWSWNGKGTITVELKDEEDELVAGGTLTIYQVALLEQDDGNMVWTFTSDFTSCGVSLSEISSDASSQASQLAAYVAANDITGDTVPNLNGTVVFNKLELGLYLIVQTESSGGYWTMNPFVVSVPLDVDGSWVYTVDAGPKVEPMVPQEENPEPETPEPETPTTTTTTLPQTGQLNWPVPVLAICGLFMIGLGSVLVLSDRRKAASR